MCNIYYSLNMIIFNHLSVVLYVNTCYILIFKITIKFVTKFCPINNHFNKHIY